MRSCVHSLGGLGEGTGSNGQHKALPVGAPQHDPYCSSDVQAQPKQAQYKLTHAPVSGPTAHFDRARLLLLLLVWRDV